MLHFNKICTGKKIGGVCHKWRVTVGMTSIDPYQDGATVTLKRGVGGKTLETILIVDL